MVLTAYNALSPVTGLFCHRRFVDCSAKLDASVGASGPHDLAVRIGIARLATPSASIASRSTFVTTRTPLVSGRDGGKLPRFRIFRNENILVRRSGQPKSHDSVHEIGFFA